VSQLRNADVQFWYEQRHPGWPTSRTGVADLSEIEVPQDLQAYVCGPVPFIESISQQLLDKGVAAASIRHELFGPEFAASR